RHLLERAGKHDGLARHRRIALHPLERHGLYGLHEPRHHFAVVRLAEELDDLFRERIADAADRVEILERMVALDRLDELLERAEVACEEPRDRFADMPNAERIDESVERDLAARLDGGH